MHRSSLSRTHCQSSGLSLAEVGTVGRDLHCELMTSFQVTALTTEQGHRNRKAFALFLSYATLLAMYCCATAGIALMYFTEHSPRGQVYDYAPISWAFLLLLGGILCVPVLRGHGPHHF